MHSAEEIGTRVGEGGSLPDRRCDQYQGTSSWLMHL